MKKLVLLAAMALLPCLAIAQQTETAAPVHISINKPAEEYCIISTHKGIFERTLCIDIDRGQGPEVDKRLRDDTGKELRFNSLAGALNYMAENGWLYVNTIKEANRDDPDYLMRRPLPVNNFGGLRSK